jgi:serine/threonine-protein kinase
MDSSTNLPSLLRVGRTVGDYVLLSELGRGGFGVVYEARDNRDQSRVALKTLRADLKSAQGQRALTRFLLEVRAVKQLRHPNVVKYIDGGQLKAEDGSVLAYYAMELLPGETLDQLVRKGGPLKPFEAASVIRQAAVGLYTAHCQGIIHRDIKPGNIMLAPNGRAVVTDFGVCKIMEVHNVTSAGQVVGTARYLSPEQFMGSTLDARSDVFALGALFFYLLTGEHLRIAKDLVVLSRTVARGEDQKRAREMPGIPNAFRPVLLKAVALETHARFQNALDLAHALEEACLSREIQALYRPAVAAPSTTPPPLPRLGRPLVVDQDATVEDGEVDQSAGATEVEVEQVSAEAPPPGSRVQVFERDGEGVSSHEGEERSPWLILGVMVGAAVGMAWLLAMWLE